MIPLARKRKGAKFGIPMYDFHPLDARAHIPRAGLDQLRRPFCLTELAELTARAAKLTTAVNASSHAPGQQRGCAEVTP